MAELHTATFPHTRDVRTIEIKMQRLDDAVQSLKLVQPLMLKIDVQGYEERVLRGGEKTLALADVVLVETSLEKLYDGQSLFDDVYRLLTTQGFTYRGSFDPEQNAIIWGTGQPNPPYSNEVRGGDNLYSDSIVAIDIDTGGMVPMLREWN